MLGERGVELRVLQAHVRAYLFLLVAVKQDEEISFGDDQQVEDVTWSLLRSGVCFEETGAFGKAVTRDILGQANASPLDRSRPVRRRNPPAKLASANALSNEEPHASGPPGFSTTPQLSDAIHSGLFGSIDADLDDERRGGQIKGNAASLNDFREEQPDSRGHI